MKIFSEPTDWKDLQNKVCLLLQQAGFTAETEKKVATPRGEVELDVYAIDPNSIDKISYVVECKNWINPINQSVIHSFMTVMNETGCNIGYIVSINGFQSGAVKYVDFTNIKLFTFEKLQEHYYKTWMRNYFSPKVEEIIERLVNYTEPCNTKRQKTLNKVSDECQEAFNILFQRYNNLAVLLSMVTGGINYMMKVNPMKDYTDFNHWNQVFNECANLGLELHGIPLSDTLPLLKDFVDSITAEFDALFDKDIFEYA